MPKARLKKLSARKEMKRLRGPNEADAAKKDSSFLQLLDTHQRMMQSFFLHQEALLQRNFRLAHRRLIQYERRIRKHIQEEERWLMPVYARAGNVSGGQPQLFIGEHRRIEEFIDRLKALLQKERGRERSASRHAIEILYQEAMFRWLLEHHDEREKQILYPTLDRVTSKKERNVILKKCSFFAKHSNRV
ncbi:MAG: hemerythrin domain-containing protein [Acidobacteriia bacterium]|nr:hemerythrin domain-containing protein [Terriglobia bacterium]